MSWNREVDRAILSEVPDAEIREIKTRRITKRIKNHITILGEHPAKFASIILYAIDLLSKIITNTLEAAKAMKEKLILADSPIETPEIESSPPITIRPVADQEDDVLDTSESIKPQENDAIDTSNNSITAENDSNDSDEEIDDLLDDEPNMSSNEKEPEFQKTSVIEDETMDDLDSILDDINI
jgi:hypothetical protein